MTLFGSSAAAWPAAARAQQARIPVIGYLGSETPGASAFRLRAFRQGLSTTGFDEGRNVAFEYRWAEGNNDRLPALAADLVRRGVDVIMTPSSAYSLRAAKAATTSTPIVFELGVDPVALGFVASLNRPGGNMTGATSLNSELGPKRMELLHELLPGAGSVTLLVNPNNLTAEHQTAQMRAAANARKLDLNVIHAATDGEIDSVFAKSDSLRAGGLVISADFFYVTRSKSLAALALHHAVPTIGFTREFVTVGGLMSYGGIFADTHRQAGIYAGRILNGEKPGNLPVHQVTKFDLLINLRTAKTLGVSAPLPLLALASEVIE